jgi:hypothetical protein
MIAAAMLALAAAGNKLDTSAMSTPSTSIGRSSSLLYRSTK